MGKLPSAQERGQPEHGWRMFIDYYNGEGFWDRLRPAVREKLLATSPLTSLLTRAPADHRLPHDGHLSVGIERNACPLGHLLKNDGSRVRDHPRFHAVRLRVN